MSLYIKEYKSYDWDEMPSCAKCDDWNKGRNCAAVIKSDHIRIPVCEDCLLELKKEIDEALKKCSVRCEKCQHFLANPDGWNHYHSRCELSNKDICHDDTCEKFCKREGNMRFMKSYLEILKEQNLRKPTNQLRGSND